MLLMNRLPVIIYLGAGILSWTAGEMITEDQKLQPLLKVRSHPSEQSLMLDQ